MLIGGGDYLWVEVRRFFGLGTPPDRIQASPVGACLLMTVTTPHTLFSGRTAESGAALRLSYPAVIVVADTGSLPLRENLIFPNVTYQSMDGCVASTLTSGLVPTTMKAKGQQHQERFPRKETKGPEKMAGKKNEPMRKQESRLG